MKGKRPFFPEGGYNIAMHRVMELGEFIRRRRLSLRLTQKDVSASLGYTPQALSKIEKGYSTLGLNLLIPLCNELQISVTDLASRNLSAEYKTVPYPPINEDAFFHNLRSARLHAGVSQKDEAVIVGVSKRTIITYEKRKATPSTEFLRRFSEYYGLDAERVLFDQLFDSENRPIK